MSDAPIQECRSNCEDLKTSIAFSDVQAQVCIRQKTGAWVEVRFLSWLS